MFSSRTGDLFDPMIAFESIVELVLGAVFKAARIERVALQGLRDNSLPDLLELLNAFTTVVFYDVLEDIIHGFQIEVPSSAALSINEESIYLKHYCEVIALQTGLVNHYIELTTSSSVSSFTFSQINAHLATLRANINSAISIGGILIRAPWSNQQRSAGYLMAHLQTIMKMIDGNRKFVNFANSGVLPLGPPI